MQPADDRDGDERRNLDSQYTRNLRGGVCDDRLTFSGSAYIPIYI